MQPQHVNGQNICRTGLDYLITGWYPLKKKNWLYFYNSKELRSPEIKTKENTKRTLGEYISQLFDSRNMKHFSNASPSYSWNDMTMDLYILHKLIKNRIMSISKLIYGKGISFQNCVHSV
ncbi:unnamed protein product [Cuscuta epithymum]|uniref:Uncharacterized protein n=1 Tax=Cuscuta epithymum TaxID=186058 RepID=A0AAV0CZT7_9ASTE|nr:unnamed protein product [Cuscuta epithymum]